MYRYKISPQAQLQIANLAYSPAVTTVIDRIGELESDPYTISKPTKKPSLGNHYINCGSQYSATFNVNDGNNTIEILQVVRQALLHKLLTGKIVYS